MNPETVEQPTSYILSNLRKLDERQRDQTAFLSQLTTELNNLTRELINTNYSMFSTTSIEEGYSNLRIEEGRSL
jgi:hypothetical protein